MTQMISSACQNKPKHNAALYNGAETPHRKLNHHENQPGQSNRHMQSVTSDQCKEGGKKRAALWGRSHCNHAVEFAKLENEKCRSQEESSRGFQKDAVVHSR